MATLTIIKDDGYVALDGIGMHNIDCSSLASNVHAIQFDGTNGEIEYNDGKNNEAITSITAYSTITDLYTTAKNTYDAEIKTNNEAEAAQKLTYVWKRINDDTTKYASIEEQLDQQYKDAINGTTTWKDSITAVKAAHPKP